MTPLAFLAGLTIGRFFKRGADYRQGYVDGYNSGKERI